MKQQNKTSQAGLSHRQKHISMPDTLASFLLMTLSIAISWPVWYSLLILMAILIMFQVHTPEGRYFASKKGYGQR